MSSKKKCKLEKKLEHEDVFCVACRCIYIQPVTMPCKHTLCLECFKNMVNLTAYQCPLCRKRISNWLRKYKHDWNSMINESLWEAVQQQYPVEVQKKLNGEDDGLEEIICCQGLTRVKDQVGEMKKEYDSFMLRFSEEQQEMEQHNFSLATELQKEEEAKAQNQAILNNELTQNDEKLAVTIQKKFQQELQQLSHLNETDLLMAQQLQNQLLPKTSTKQIPPKKGPLDKIFTKLYTQVQCENKENNSLSSYPKPSSTISILTRSASSSSSATSVLSSNTSSSDQSVTIGSPELLGDENLDTCTCGRLQNDFNSSIPPCKFCTAQITLLEDLLTKQKNDFLMAKELEKKLNPGNFDDYNLRKRPCSTLSSGHKKIKKISKGQRTLQELLQGNVAKK